MTDEQLVQLCREGDMDAYGVLFARHRGQVELMARRVVRDEARAEDLAQAVFVRLFDRIQQVQDINNFTAWLNRVTRNYAIDELRRDKCIQMVDLEGSGAENLAPDQVFTRPADNDPFTETSRNEIKDLVHDTIRDLPANYRTALSLRFLQGHSIPEIAEAMGLQTTQVNTLLHRAKKCFRKDMIKGITNRPNMPRECRTFGPKLALLIEDDLGAEAAAVKEHVASCKYCQQTERDLRATAYERAFLPLGGVAGLRLRMSQNLQLWATRAANWGSNFVQQPLAGGFNAVADRAAIAVVGLLAVGVAASFSAGQVKGVSAQGPLGGQPVAGAVAASDTPDFSGTGPMAVSRDASVANTGTGVGVQADPNHKTFTGKGGQPGGQASLLTLPQTVAGSKWGITAVGVNPNEGPVDASASFGGVTYDSNTGKVTYGELYTSLGVH
ncbi:MAG: RNA polymerase sigma factor [Candidatus Dormibacteria bacterium]